MLLLLVSLTCAAPVPADPNEAEVRLRLHMARVAEEAEKQGPLLPTNDYATPLAESVVVSQNLAEQGKYAEAADRLQKHIDDRLADDWKGMLRTRVTLLRKWSAGGRVDLKDYRQFYLETGPEWFRDRAAPVVKLWKMSDVPPVEKYQLLAEMLAWKRDPAGQAVALEAVAGVKGVAAEEAADALVRAGSLRLELKDEATAVANWSRVMDGFGKTWAWPHAVYSLGRIRQGQGKYIEAIRLYRAVLDRRPAVDRPGRWFDGRKHESALSLSECYETLGDYPLAIEFVEKARTEYRFVSFCGTCAEQSRAQLARRLADLKARQAERAVPPKR